MKLFGRFKLKTGAPHRPETWIGIGTISFSWLLFADGFQFFFLLRDSKKNSFHSAEKRK